MLLRALVMWVSLLVLVAGGCKKTGPETAPVAKAPEVFEGLALSITYPLEGSLFPPEIVAPIIRWTDPSAASLWQLEFRLPGGETLVREVRSNSFKPEAELWETLKKGSVEQPLELLIKGLAESGATSALSGGVVRFQTSRDPVGDSLFFRDLVLPFSLAVKDPRLIKWRFGSIAREEQPPVVLEGLPVCGNCHSFSQDASVMGMDVDYANNKGSYAIVEVAETMDLAADKVITWGNYKREDRQQTFGLLPQMSPNGRYSMATVKDRSVFVAVDSDLSFSQLFFPVKGILAWYDRETKAFGALGGADNPDLVQSNPVWNHDGSVITFARAPKYDLNKLKDENAAVLSKEEVAEFLTGGKDMKFDLYRVPFNEGKGGEALPIPGAAANGKSNFFPRYSPDGKWMVFCQATSFMLLQPDSMLYIMPAAGGTPRKMTCNRPLMNSWHSWSSNSRWLVFSSKPNGPYTQLFLTHIDEDGNDSPPVLLEHFTAPDRAANIPEFVKLHPDAIKKIEVNFLDETSYFRAAMAFMPFDGEVRTREDYQNAVVAYARSVELDPKNPMVRSEYGLALVAVGRSEEALEQWQQASKLAPDYPDPLFNIALLYSQEGREAEAITLFKKVLELDDKFMEANLSLGSVYFKQGRTQEALAQWEAALKTKPEWQKALYNIGLLKMHGGRFDEARDYYLRSTVADPTHLESQLGLGLVLYISGRTDEGIKRLEDALEQIPNEPALMDLLSIGYARSGDFKSAESLSGKALEQAKARENQKLSADIAAHLAVIKKGQVPGL